MHGPAGGRAREEAPPLLDEALRRMRAGEVKTQPGYDGEYGVIRVFDEAERRAARPALVRLRPTAPEPEAGGRVQEWCSLASGALSTVLLLPLGRASGPAAGGRQVRAPEAKLVAPPAGRTGGARARSAGRPSVPCDA